MCASERTPLRRLRLTPHPTGSAHTLNVSGIPTAAGPRAKLLGDRSRTGGPSFQHCAATCRTSAISSPSIAETTDFNFVWA